MKKMRAIFFKTDSFSGTVSFNLQTRGTPMRTTSVNQPKTIYPPETPKRNSGIPFELGWLKQVQVNKSAA
jgi:hypothetical protein